MKQATLFKKQKNILRNLTVESMLRLLKLGTISFNGVVIKSTGVFADLLSRIITMYRAVREENPLKAMFSYDLVLIFDLGIAHRLIVPGDMVF